MAYNLYSVQMARAWAQRIEKENAQAEKFWMTQALKDSGDYAALNNTGGSPRSPGAHGQHGYAGSTTGSRAGSAAPTGFSSKTSFLKVRLERLEQDLAAERESRKKVETDLQELKSSLRR